MPSYSHITICGHIGQDPRTAEVGGKPVANFSVAVSEKRGEEEHTSWYEVSAWGKLAENVTKYCHKGMAVLVSGKPKIETYNKKDGAVGHKVSVYANDVTFLSKRDDGVSETAKPQTAATGSAPF